MSKPQLHIAIADLGGGDESSLRPFLERLACRVVVYRVGRPMDLVHILRGEDLYERTDHLILDAHGQDGALLIPEIDETIALPTEPLGPWGPSRIAECAKLPAIFVLSTACSTGSPAMARAILTSGARAYLAPEGYPDAADGLLFQQRFYYELVHRGASEEDAIVRAKRDGGDATLYRCYTRT